MLPDSKYITPFIINNVSHTSTKTFPVNSPTADAVWHASAATTKDVEAITAAAEAAFPLWATTKIAKRRELLLKFTELLEREAPTITECMTLETGATEIWGGFNVKIGVEMARQVIAEMCLVFGKVIESETEGREAMIVNEPLGVVLSIIPWNGPVPLFIRGILYALAAGNTVIIKSSEHSPRTQYILASLFITAGFPPGVVNIIGHARSDGAEITNALIASRAVRKISFTGSSAVGRRIASVAGEHLKPVIMELGGKAPFIVCEDADIDAAAQTAAAGGLVNSGQVCMSTEKIIVHSSIVDKFTAALVAILPQFGESQKLVLADGQAKVKGLVDRAVASGAKIVNEEAYKKFDFKGNTRSFPNLVLKDVTDKMDIYRLETFGPTVSVMTYENDEEALRIANDTEYGLAGAVWTKDSKRGMKLAKGIQTGLVSINGSTLTWEPQLSASGVKNSGYGEHSLHEFFARKIIVYDI